MKNFKRVISAVIALALSASTLVAVSASKFSDVDNTNYAEAIEVLTALDIVHGYEDGSFKPEGEITRAEAATMIVGALNMMKEAQAAAGTSKFTDVNDKASWASGYVNVGVAQGFINGMDDTTFAPQDNVTYAQMCVMLTLITGYGDYAAAYGGYPTGYTTMAASAGINKGVALSADAKLQRGQVAQMLYNAMSAPLLGVKSYNLSGNDYGMQDGTNGLAFKTLLAEKFEGYEADVKITAVPKSGDSLNKGEIRIQLTKAAYLDKTTSKFAAVGEAGTQKNFGVVYDDFGVEDMLNLSGKAIVKLDENDRWHLVYFKASDIDKVVVKAEDYKSAAQDGKSVDADGKITFGSKNYTVSHNTVTVGNNEADAPAIADFATTFTYSDATTGRAKIYVNGQPYRVTVTGPNGAAGIYAGVTPNPATFEAAFNELHVSEVLERAQGDVTLIDDITDTAHAGYDKLMATVYDVAKVGGVIKSNGETSIQVSFKEGLNPNVTTIKLSDDAIADGDVDLKVKNADGEDVALSSIKKGDIIAYAIAQNNTSVVRDPEVIDIRVTDKKISGMVTRVDTTDETYTIGDTAYKTVSRTWNDQLLTVGTSYSVYLDPFGRIYDYADVEAVTERYAIVDSWVAGDNALKLILADGTVKTYEVESNIAVTQNNANISRVTVAASVDDTHYLDVDGTLTPAELGNFAAQTGANEPAVANRVIRYTVKTSTGKINGITVLQPDQILLPTDEYKEGTAKLGNFTIAATTDSIHYQARDNVSKFSNSSYKDKENYMGAIFADRNNFGNTAMFVVLTNIGQDIDGESRFAVVRKPASRSRTADGDVCLSINVLYQGEEKDMLFTLNSGADNGLAVGDAFFFGTDSDGLVNSFYRIYTNNGNGVNGNNPGLLRRANHAEVDFLTVAGNASPLAGNVNGSFRFDPTKWSTAGWNPNADLEVVYGVVVKSSDRGVEFLRGNITRIPSTDNTRVGWVNGDGTAWDLDNDGNDDAFNFNPAGGAPNCYSLDNATDATNHKVIDMRNAQSTISYSFAREYTAYRFAINENRNAQYKSITVGDPTESAISGYEIGRNTGLYDLDSKANDDGETHLAYALALVVDGDIVEIYTIAQ